MKKIIVFLIVLSFVFSPVSFSNLLIFTQASDYEEIEGYQEWTENKVIDGWIDITQEATLVIKKGVTITFNSGGMAISGKVIVNGTKSNPVIFKKGDGFNYAIYINESGSLAMENTDMSGSGLGSHVVYNPMIMNTVFATSITGGINIQGGSFSAQECNFHNNLAPVVIGDEEQKLNQIRVNRSKFVDNDNFDVYYLGSDGNQLNFQYNWWGSADGPLKYCYSPDDCYYEKFNSEVDFSHWLTSEEFHDPVVIIPGILGSQKKDGKWKIDPIAHTYDNLYDEFADNGYTPEKDLFEFPYEWRDSNVENAKLLRTKIQEIKEKNHWPKVDIVAHSMGGLLAREYIESDYYQDDVDQLITLGTPHNGAPEAYLKWEGNEWFWSARDLYAKHILDQEAKKQGFADGFDYIHQRPISSLKELLPVYNYIQDIENNYEYRNYSNGYPRNEFLENINSDDKKLKLNNVEFGKIVGNVENNNSTIAGFKVTNVNMGKYWVDGYPLGFEIPLIGDRGMIYSNGDVTVPLESARSSNIPADYTIELDSNHGDLPTDAQKDILELLTGVRPGTEIKKSHVKDIFLALVFSPIDIQVVAPDGKRMGKNFVTGGEYNEIPGAYYSGSNTENEFLTIPNPIDGEYKILTQGTGEGEYKIEAAKISEDENNPGKTKESTAEISGTATIGSQEELVVEIAGNEVIVDQDKTPPVVRIISPENKTYQNNQTLETKYDVTDDKSLPDKVKTKVSYDGNPIAANTIDLPLEHLGVHNISVKATDEAGNVGEEKVDFTSDTNVNSIISNINHYFSLHLITNIGTKNYLRAKLQIIRGEMQVIDELKKTKLPKFAKEKLLGVFQKIVNSEIDLLERQIQKEKNLAKTIDPKVRELLVESLEKIRP